MTSHGVWFDGIVLHNEWGIASQSFGKRKNNMCFFLFLLHFHDDCSCTMMPKSVGWGAVGNLDHTGFLYEALYINMST